MHTWENSMNKMATIRYGNDCLQNSKHRKLEYNSYGGMDKYISPYEEVCDKVEESKQHNLI